MSEDAVLKNTHGREQLNGCSDEDSERVDELYCVYELAVLRVVGDDFDSRICPKRCITERTNRSKNHRDDGQDNK